jgi:NAD-dependent DNA ligase
VPVILSGNTTVTYVTAHNAKYVHDNKIGKGSVIRLVRSGDVIPYIVSVVKPAKKADMPKMETIWNDTNIELIATDPDDDTKRKIQIKQNLHFFRKLGVKFLSEGIITKLYDSGYNSIESIVAAASSKDKDLYEIDGLGIKMVDKIYDQIDNAFLKIKLPELMSGSLKFGRGIGVRKIREILKKYPNILNMSTDDKHTIQENVMMVPGFSKILATKFAKNLKSFMKFIDVLKANSKYNLKFNVPAKKTVIATHNNDNSFAEQVIAMTGFRSDDITEYVESRGGKIGSVVSKNTTLVLYKGDKPSSKLEKAKELGIKLMTREKFEKLYNIK